MSPLYHAHRFDQLARFVGAVVMWCWRAIRSLFRDPPDDDLTGADTATRMLYRRRK